MRATPVGKARAVSAARRAVCLVLTLILASAFGTDVAIADSLRHSGPPTPGDSNPGSISAQIAAVEQQIASLPQREAALDAQQTSLDERTASYNQRSKNVLARLETTNQKIDEHNAVVDSYPGGAAPSAVASSVNAEAAALNAEMTQLQAEASAIAGEGDAIKSEQGQLESQKEKLDSQRSALETERQQLLQQLSRVLLAALAAPAQTVQQAPGGDPARPPSSSDRGEQAPSTGGDPVSRRAERAALDEYARSHQVEVDKRPVTATLSPDSVARLSADQAAQLQLRRTFDGLVRKPTGTYKAVAITPVEEQPVAQQAFNDAIAGGGAVAVRDGKRIIIDEVEQIPALAANPDACSTPNSFAPGTPVLLADGTSRPIEQITPGTQVRATDPTTGRTEAREATALITGEGVKHLVEITIDTDGDAANATATVTATEGHPFWAPDLHKWVPASELKAGSLLQTSAGTRVQVTAVRSWTATERVHNLTIDSLHTYYVLAGSTPVLVHNCDPYEIPHENGSPVGGHTSGTARQPLTGQRPNSVYTRTGKDGTPVQNTIYDHNGDAVGHFDFKTHPGTDGPHGHVFETPGIVAGHGPGAPHIPEGDLPWGWNLRP